MRKITIDKVANGFIVVVGCQTLVFEKAETVAVEFLRYAANPNQVEEEYLARYCPIRPAVPDQPQQLERSSMRYVRLDGQAGSEPVSPQ